MSPKISVLIRKNSHEVIRVITNHYTKCYCRYNNEGTDEMNFPLFPTIPLLLRIVVAAFSIRSLKTSIVSCLRSTPARFTIHQNNISVFPIRK
jgi:hypothetical protein